MIFKRYDGFEINPADSVTKTLTDAKTKVEELQSAETGQVGWYINVISPAKKFLGVVLSDAMKLQFPALEQYMELYNGEVYGNSISTINTRIDGLVSQITSYVNSPSSLSDKINGFTTGQLIGVTSTIPVNLNNSHKRCVVGTKIYFLYVATLKYQIAVYDTATNVWSNINTLITAPSAGFNEMSLTADVANNILYFNAAFYKTGWNYTTKPSTTSSIYKVTLSDNSVTLVTTFTDPISESNIIFLNNKLYTTPSKLWSVNTTTQSLDLVDCVTFKTYNIAGNSWSTGKTTSGLNAWVGKYNGRFNGNYYVFDVNVDLYFTKTSAFQWYPGSLNIDEILTYDKYEIQSTVSAGLSAFRYSGNNDYYTVKLVYNVGQYYLLLHNTTDKTIKRIVLTNPELSTTTSLMHTMVVGTKLFIFDKNATKQIQTIDLVSYL